jgi:sterol desaturase/sphingolipid hydroxylase (fatty acid hydroxylase superfamily)
MARRGAIETLAASHANYWFGLTLDWLVAAALMINGLMRATDVASVAATILCAGFVYSFYEYALHRWLYHGPASVVRRVHALHHETDMLIGAPFFFSLGVTALSWCVARTVLDAPLATVFAATVLGSYVYQSTVHHLLHAHAFRRHVLFRRLRRHHAIHHARGDVNFGLTWLVWDRLLGTAYRPDSRGRE